MGKRGPRARNERQKSREGYGSASTDAFAGTNAARPDYLRGYAAARFDFWWSQLKSVGRHSAVDADLLASLCECESDERDLRKRVRREGRILTRSGNRYTNPAVKQLDQTLRMKRGLLRDLALTPKERKTSGEAPMPTGEPDDPMAKFNARRPEGPPPGLKVTHG